ncbi:MAG: hypothetical protein LW832_11000, partial [Parachlamydia sp.]|nr:hypothetical protein [Parachlamydia sp.]
MNKVPSEHSQVNPQSTDEELARVEDNLLQDKVGMQASKLQQLASTLNDWLPWNWSLIKPKVLDESEGDDFSSNSYSEEEVEEDEVREFIPPEALEMEGEIPSSIAALPFSLQDLHKTITKTNQTAGSLINWISTKAEVVGQGMGHAWSIARDYGQFMQSDMLSVALGAGDLFAQIYRHTADKEMTLAHAEERMLNAGGAPLVELFQFMSQISKNLLKQTIADHQAISASKGPYEKDMTDQLFDQLASNEELINDLILIDLANKFTSISDLIIEKQNEGSNQHPLEILLSILSEQFLSKIDMENFSKVEEKYRSYRNTQAELISTIFPDISPEKQKLINQSIAKGSLSNQALAQLFPEFARLSFDDYIFLHHGDIEIDFHELEEKWKAYQNFLKSMEDGHARHVELQQLFHPVIENVLFGFFPGTMGLLQSLPSSLTKMAVNRIADQVIPFYEPFEEAAQNKSSEEVLKSRFGAGVDIDNFLKAPSAFAIGFASYYIQQDPSAIALVQKGLASVSEEKKNIPSSYKELEEEVGRLSQETLAGWLLQGLQKILQAKDPQLVQAGVIADKGLKLILTNLLAKGCILVIPEGQMVSPDQMIKVLLDSLIQKFKNLQDGEQMSPSMWKELVKDLPFPSFVKDKLASLLTEGGISFQNEFNAANADIAAIQGIYQNSAEKIMTFKAGEQLIALADALADPLLKAATTQSAELLASSSAVNTLEDLFSEFFPGVKVDPQLIHWFKQNVSALGQAEEGQIAPTELLKQGIRAVALKGMVHVIEAN